MKNRYSTKNCVIGKNTVKRIVCNIRLGNQEVWA